MSIEHRYQCEVPPEDDGERLDRFLAIRIPEYSRSQLRTAISRGEVLIDGRTAKPAYKLKSSQSVFCELSKPAVVLPEPEDIPLDIIYEDDHLVAINKPASMVVHPAKGHWKGTLVSGLIHHFSKLSAVGGSQRPGIIHRLDRDTTGVIVVAKHDEAHSLIAKQFELRTTLKEYHCLTLGIPDRDRDLIDAPIGPHPYHRERMAIRRDHPKKRAAQTFYEVAERFRHIALVNVQPKTGRTHQIRVHMAHLGCPILADRLYGGKPVISRTFLKTGRDEEQSAESVEVLNRQALHAASLTIKHPFSGKELTFNAPYPNDFRQALNILRS